ncbi:transposase [Streptomyces griseoluteus]|uniref:transposase n=1 Tax=Streptomyces griseoluteus TaxID=29306 RepID=UPI003689DC4D
MGTFGKQILAAWHAKELLRGLLRLTFKHAHTRPDREAVSAARHRFNAHIADHAHLPELVTLAETVDQWWDGIEAYVTTGITNAASEGNNRVVKLEARQAYGFRNRANQRLRSRCATTRRARGCLTPHQVGQPRITPQRLVIELFVQAPAKIRSRVIKVRSAGISQRRDSH